MDAAATREMRALVDEVVADVLKRSRGSWRTHTSSAALGAIVSLIGSAVAVLWFFNDLKHEAELAKTTVDQHAPRITAVEQASHDAQGLAVAAAKMTAEQDPRLRVVETAVSVLTSRIDQQGKTLDAVQTDTKEILRRLPK